MPRGQGLGAPRTSGIQGYIPSWRRRSSRPCQNAPIARWILDGAAKTPQNNPVVRFVRRQQIRAQVNRFIADAKSKTNRSYTESATTFRIARRTNGEIGPRRFVWCCLFLGACTAGATGCRRPHQALTQRLVDSYKAESVENRAVATQPTPRTEWRFDGAAAEGIPAALASTRGWEVFHDVSGFAIRSGRLVGRASGALPILHFERTSGLDDKDVVHALEVRLRVSAGANLTVSLVGAPRLDRATSWTTPELPATSHPLGPATRYGRTP